MSEDPKSGDQPPATPSAQPIAFPPRSRKRVFSVNCAENAPPPPPRDYIIKGILAPGELSVWYGEPGSGKSFLLLHIAYAISQRRQVFGRRINGAPVLYHCLEGEQRFQKRLRAIFQRWGMSRRFFYITESADLFSNGNFDLLGLIDAVKQTEAKLLVVDTLARTMGAGSENESKDMNRLIQAFDKIRRETGAHVAVVHHCGKDKTKGMRGHSSLLGAADAVVEVKRVGETLRNLRVAKAKDDEDGDSHSFMLDIVEMGEDADGDPITSCVVTETGKAQRSPDIQLSKPQQLALNALRDGCASRKSPSLREEEWREVSYRAGISNSADEKAVQKAFKRAREALIEVGLVSTSDGAFWATSQ